ncbi:MAG: HlyD family secretion protein [Deltaproteobacteria bacterium]|nr:HlyD family secretion protein [Deltaproteobacteria bacterium]
MKKKKISFIIVFLLVVVVGLIYGLHYKKTHITTTDAYVQGHIHWISSRVNGVVKKVLVEENQWVKEGKLLVILDKKPFGIKVKEKEASLDLEKKRLNEIKKEIDATLAQLTLKKAKLEQTQLDWKRAKNLYKKNALSKQNYEHMLTGSKIAQAEYDFVKESVNQKKALFAVQKSLIKQKRAQLNEALLNKAYTCIYAPIGGFVVKKNVEAGNYVKIGVPLLSLVNTKDVWIEANYKETKLHHIKKGLKAIIKIDAYPKKRFHGYVESIMAGTGAAFSLFPPENASGNWIKVVQRVPVKIVFCEDVPLLRIGMSAKVTILSK